MHPSKKLRRGLFAFRLSAPPTAGGLSGVVNSLLARGLDLYGVSAAHVATDTLRAELQAAEQRKRTLTAELEALTGRRQATASLDVERLRRELVRRASEVRTLLGQDIPRARKILRRLLVGRMECEASDDGRQVGYRFKARGSYAALMPAQLSTPDMVTPGGSAAWCGFQLAGEAVA